MSRRVSCPPSLRSAAALLLAATAVWAEPPYAGESVVRVHPRDTRELRTILALTEDVWSHAVAVGRPVDARLSPTALAALRRSGMPFETLHEDLGAAVAAERARLDARADEGGIAGESFFADFRDLAAIETKLDALVAARPDLCSIETIGASLEGRPIRALRISTDPDLPAALLNACQHAREWISPMVAMALAAALVEGEGTDPRVTALLGRLEVWVIPVVNPDGYVHSWGPQRLWRKNRRPNGDGSIGVDLNRNWGFQWGGAGASSSPGSDTYRGPAPFSEPETQALRDFHLARPDLVASIDFHSYGQLILSPWGYTTAAHPQAPLFAEIVARMRDAIATTTGQPYTVGPIASTLYVASGNVVDWAFAERGMVSLTTELRDTGQGGFVLPPSQIEPTVRENLAATLELLEATAQPAIVTFPAGRPDRFDAYRPTEVRVAVLPGLGGPSIAAVSILARAGSAAFAAVEAVPLGGNLWSAAVPAFPCGANVEWFVRVETTAGDALHPFAGAAAPFATPSIRADLLFRDDFELDLGWTAGVPGDTATGGIWIRVDPVGTVAQPEDDHSPDGTKCYVTGQGVPGGAAGAADVDNGVTTLLSPPLDLSNPDAVVGYARWYSNDRGAAPNADSMPIEISADGLAWTTLELVTENANAWVVRSFRVADFIPPSARARVRFVARDLGAGSLVEAGVDEFRVIAFGCPAPPGDVNADGRVDAGDLAMVLSAWGAAGGPADLDGDGTVGAGDLSVLLAAWTG